MKLFFGNYFLVLCVVYSNCLFAQEGGTGFKKSHFYAVMAGKNEEEINQQLGLLQSAAPAERNAYEGALLMKKAGMATAPKKKLNLFKEGHKKLEAVLQKDSTNTEFRFLRLMIQEHAPGALGYKKDLERDNLYIRNNFKKLSPVVQDAVIDYSKTSKILKLGNL